MAQGGDAGHLWTRESKGETLSPEEAEARSLASQARYAQALPLFEKVVAAEPRNWRALGGLALTLGKLGQGEKAVENFEAALFINYESYENHLNFAVLLMELGMTGRARTEFAVALELGGKDPVVHFSYALAMHELGRSADATAAIDLAIDLNPNVPAFWNLKAVILTANEPDDALRAFEEADRLGLEGASFRNNYGILLSRLGLWERAEEMFARALDLDPELEIASVNRAKSLLVLGRNEEAYELLSRLRGEGDTSDELLELLARSCVKTERWGEAREAVSNMTVKNAESWNLLALAHRAEGELDRAVEAARAATRLSPENPPYWVNLGVCLAESGAVEEALAAWEQALELDPENATAKANRERFGDS